MLYDNAQLVSLYSDAWLMWKDHTCKETVNETLAFVRKEMTHPDGGFYSSMDADSEGIEGKYYTWGTGEFKKVAGAGADLVARFYQLDGKGLWESGRNILMREVAVEGFAPRVGLQPSQFRTVLKSARTKLMKARLKRVRPALDDKVLTSWNALMMKGFIDAYRAFENQDYLKTAVKNADFLIREVMDEEGRLFHSWKNGRATINGFLEDYSFLAEALIALYEVTFEKKYLDRALLLAEYAVKHFYDGSNGFFFITSSLDPALFARKQEVSDNVIPSSNSTMARVLHMLGLVYEREDFSKISTGMVLAIKEHATRYPSSFSNWASLMLSQVYPYHTIAITGEECLEKAARIRKMFHPNLLICGSKEESDLPILQNRFIEGETMMYLCTGKECRLPTSDVEEVWKQLEKLR
jgi:uncharacterized protein YyaL (SSP411 family)